MTDSVELMNMFEASNHVHEAQYEKVEWVQLSDEQGGIYDSGQISYNTSSLGAANIVYSDSIFALPITVSHEDDKKVCVKNSLLSFIQGLIIESVAGTQIVSESISTPIVNNLRLLIDSSTDFLDQNELMFFGKDQNISPDVSGEGYAIVGGASSRVTSKRATIDPLHNPALASRISVFDTRATKYIPVLAPLLGYRQIIALIPLKFIHDFFRQINFPLTNAAFRFTFNIAGVAGYQNYCPWTCPDMKARQVVGAADEPEVPKLDEMVAPAVAAAAKPTTTIPSYVTDNFGWTSKPCLYLKKVYFAPDDAAALATKINSGFDHTITYTVSQHFPSIQTAAQINFPIGQGLIRPTRIWAFPLETGTLKSESNSFPAVIGKYNMTNVNLQLNGSNVYNNPFKSQYELYREFKQQLISAGSSSFMATPISYTDWICGMNPYCLDISRNPTVKSNADCRLTFEGLVKEGALDTSDTFDLCVVVERLRTCKIHVSAGGVSVMVKDGAE